MEIIQESFMVPLQDGSGELHLKRLYQAEPGDGVLMLHGSLENGRIFYSKRMP